MSPLWMMIAAFFGFHPMERQRQAHPLNPPNRWKIENLDHQLHCPRSLKYPLSLKPLPLRQCLSSKSVIKRSEAHFWCVGQRDGIRKVTRKRERKSLLDAPRLWQSKYNEMYITAQYSLM